MTTAIPPWTHDQLRGKAEWLLRDVPEYASHRFGTVAFGEDLQGITPDPGEVYLDFVDRVLDFCREHDGDGVILAWQWPGLPYVTVTLACPLEGAATVPVFPELWS